MKKSAHIRVSSETLALLKDESRRLEAAADAGKRVTARLDRDRINPIAPAVSMDAVIRHLLDAREQQRQRDQRYRERRRARRSRQTEGGEG